MILDRETDVTNRPALETALITSRTVRHAGRQCRIADRGGIYDTSDDLWNRTVAVNLTGVFRTVQIAAQLMKPRRSGAIVITASTNAYDGEPRLAAYNATKAGVLGILHTAANELGPYGIRVNAVCPGLIRTPLTERSFQNPAVLKDYFRARSTGAGR